MYADVRNKMKTGDVISFSGKGRTSNLIKWRTGSDISHVGMVMETEFNNAFGQRVLIIESTSLNNIPDIKTGEFIKGVQMQQLSKRLDSYDGQAYWHKLNTPLSCSGERKMLQWLSTQHNKKVPYDTFQAIGAGADFFDKFGIVNAPDFSSLFCSELVCKALQLAGIVSDMVNPSEETPADVVRYECLDRRVQIG